MENQKINQLLAELNENLKLNCCAKEITPQLIIDPKKSLFVKLHDTICDACNETENFAWYPLHTIILLNNTTNRSSGIICRDCKEKKCNIEGCVVSLLVKVYATPNSKPDYRYSNINKLEIIYI